MTWGLTNTTGASVFNFGSNSFNKTKIMVGDNYQPATLESVSKFRIYGRDTATPSNAQLALSIYDITAGTDAGVPIYSQTVTLDFLGASAWLEFPVTGAPLLDPAKKYARGIGGVNNSNSEIWRIASTGKSVDQNGLTPNPIGAGSVAYNFDFVFEVVTAPVAYSIDTIDNPIKVGSVVNITTTGLGTLTTASTIGGKAIASANAPAGDGTITCWSFADGGTAPAMGSQVVIASDGTNATDSTTVTLTTMGGYSYVTASGINYDNYSLAAVFPSVVEGDQVHIQNPDGGTLLPNLDISGFADGTYICWWRAANGVMTKKTLTINAAAIVNVAPIVTALNLSTRKNISVNGQLVATDADGDTPTYSVVSQATNGVASVNASGLVSYVPANNFVGNDSFTIGVSDGHSHTTNSVVSVTITNPVTTPSVVAISSQDIVVTSGAFSVVGVDAGIDIPIQLGTLVDCTAQFAIDSGGGLGEFATANNNVRKDYQVKIKLTATASAQNPSATVLIGGVPFTFTPALSAGQIKQNQFTAKYM